MGKYFKLSDLTRSFVAEGQGIDNSLSEDVAAQLNKLIENLLDPMRDMWGEPVWVTSGYRCPELNKAVGGMATSQHMRGEAADITTGSRDGNRQLFETIAASDLEFDQLIDEKGYSWLHISYRIGANRRQILHL